VPFPKDARTFAEHVPQVLDVWRRGHVEPGLETYEAFRARIFSARDGRVLLVTSTGVIATLAAIALGLETSMKSKMFLAVAHTSIHKFELRGDELYPTQFGATPHLDRPGRTHARTYA
jgi:broad specificity phosphatase PhoE